MATVLDFGIFSYFLPVLVFIFIFVILYALLEKTKVLGENSGMHALVAFIFSLFFVLVKPLRELITTVTPWFVIIFLLMVVILFAVMILGFKQENVTSYIGENPAITVTVIVIIAIIFFVSIGNTFPDAIGLPDEDADDNVINQVRNVVFDPRVLGLFFILIVSYFVVRTVGFIGKKD